MRHLARFRLPDTDARGRLESDLRGRGARALGPQVAFHRSGSRLLVLHCNGVLYELGLRPEPDASGRPQDFLFISATTWFAARPDFRLSDQLGAADPEEVDEFAEWQLI